MKRFVTYLLLIAMILSLVPSAMAVTVESDTTLAPVYEDSREKLNFNQGWKFYRGYISEAIETTYPQEELEKWENVNLPHSIRLEPYMNSHSTYQGDGMYIKHFLLDETYAGKKLYIEFEGIMGITDIWVNGVHMETNIANRTGDQTSYCGYLPIIIDITDVAKCDGSENIIVVHCNNEDNNLVPPGKPQNSADMTYFGGIYRDAWLEVASPVHITNANFETIVAGGGILVDYPTVSQESADVFVQTHVRNESNKDETVTVKTTILDPNGQQAAVDTCQAISLPSGGDHSFTQTITVSNPALWSLDLPQRNTLVSEVYVGEQLVDRVETKIGIRKIEMDKSYGLKINGEVQDMLNGVNRHQEYAYVGFAAPSSLQRSDAVKYKDAGFNVVRAAHYPMSNDFLDACDELGILVIEPTPGWQYYNSNPTFTNRVLDNTRAMVRRDRNHPCILAYETVLNETGNCPHEFTQLIATTAKEEHPSAKCATENSLVNGKDEIADIMYKDADKSSKAVSFTREYGDSYREQYGPSNFFDRRVMRGTGSYYPGGEGAMFKQAVKRLMGNQSGTPFFDPVDAASSSKGGASGSGRSFLANVEKRSTDPGYIGCTMWSLGPVPHPQILLLRHGKPAPPGAQRVSGGQRRGDGSHALYLQLLDRTGPRCGQVQRGKQADRNR